MSNPLVIQLRRQGVARTLQGSFAPCAHGHSWFVSIMEHHGSMGGVMVEVNYPGCSVCYGLSSSQLAYTNGSHLEYRRVKDLGEGRFIALEAIELLLPAYPSVSFASEIEAYMCYTDSEYAAYPYLSSDVFFAACYYAFDEDVILDSVTHEVLARFIPAKDMPCGFVEPEEHLSESALGTFNRAAGEYMKAHVQREGEIRARTWFAWLWSEYMKDAKPEMELAKRSRMIEIEEE